MCGRAYGEGEGLTSWIRCGGRGKEGSRSGEGWCRAGQREGQCRERVWGAHPRCRAATWPLDSVLCKHMADQVEHLKAKVASDSCYMSLSRGSLAFHSVVGSVLIITSASHVTLSSFGHTALIWGVAVNIQEPNMLRIVCKHMLAM